MTIEQGGNIEFKCTSSAVPVPDFTWSKDDSGDMKTGARFTVTNSGVLRIAAVQVFTSILSSSGSSFQTYDYDCRVVMPAGINVQRRINTVGTNGNFGSKLQVSCDEI